MTDRIEIININVNEIPASFYKKFDVVLTNPPFGIRSQKAADMNFLKQAINVKILYSFLKLFFLQNCSKNEINLIKNIISSSYLQA